MKKIILTCIALATSSLASAQIEQGTISVGGNLTLTSTGKLTTKVTGSPADTTINTKGNMNWGFSPEIGYFIKDNLAVGVNLGLGSTHQYNLTSVDGTKTKSVNAFNLGFAVFGKKYIPLNDKFYLVGKASLGYSRMSFTDQVVDGTSSFKDDDKNSMSSITLAISPGITYFANDNWAFDFTLNNVLGFNSFSTTIKGTDGVTIKSSGSGLLMNIGTLTNPMVVGSLGVHYYFR